VPPVEQERDAQEDVPVEELDEDGPEHGEQHDEQRLDRGVVLRRG